MWMNVPASPVMSYLILSYLMLVPDVDECASQSCPVLSYLILSYLILCWFQMWMSVPASPVLPTLCV